MMKDLTAGHLAAAGSLNLSHHGLVRAGFQPGMTVLVNGATGSFGSLACLVVLGMGASKVVGIGRNKGHLKRIDEKLGAVYGSRFSTAYSAADNEGDTDDDKLKKLTERLQQSAGKTGNPSTGADICIDLLGQAKTTDSTLACLRSLERGGVLVLEGSMTVPLNLSYMELMLNNLVVMGNYMYPPTTPSVILPLIASKQIDLSVLDIHPYPLDKVHEAMEHAGKLAPLEFVVLTPNQ